MANASRRAVASAVGLAMVAAVVVADAGSADGGERRRVRRARRNHVFATDQAPARAATPALDGQGAPAQGVSEVAGAPLEDSARMGTWYQGALLAMGPGRALAVNAFRGLAVVDTTDPDAPTLLSTVDIEGTSQRVYLDGDRAVVLSSDFVDGEWSTVVTGVDLSSDPSPAVTGTATVSGSLLDAAHEEGEVLLVTGGGAVGPYPLEGARLGAPSIWPYPYPVFESDVVRLTLDAAGVPLVLGRVELGGHATARVLGVDEAYLVVTRYPPVEAADPADGAMPPEAQIVSPERALVAVRSNANGTPFLSGETPLERTHWALGLDLEGDVLRMLEGTQQGTRVATFDVVGESPVPLGELRLTTPWVASFAFAGDRLAFGSTEWPVVTDPGPFEPSDPDLGRDGTFLPNADGTPGGFFVCPWYPVAQEPRSVLHVVDLSRPAEPARGASVEIGRGWMGPLYVAAGDVLTTLTQTYTTGASLLRVDVSDVDAPRVRAETELESGSHPLAVYDDLLLLSSFRFEDGQYRTGVRTVDLSGGGLVVSALLETASYAAAVARHGPLVGLASTTRLELVDVTDPRTPVRRGDVTLMVNVADVVPLDPDTAAVLVNDWTSGRIEIRTVSLPEGDALAPLDVLGVGTGDARLFAEPPLLYVVATDWTTGRSALRVVDATDPTDLRRRGSLDLAAYPGHVFLHRGALLMVRHAETFLEPAADDALVGKRRRRARPKRRQDDFGVVRMRWLRDEQGAVLDVVDLADPDAPRAARRKPLRSDPVGLPRLRGDRLYLPDYRVVRDGSSPWPRCVYGVTQVDVSDPLRPRLGRSRAVPGTLAGATDRDGVVLTTEFVWDRGQWTPSARLHVVDLNAPTDVRVLATRELERFPTSVTVGRAHAYLLSSAPVYWVLPTGAEDVRLDAANGTGTEIAIWPGPQPGGELLTLRLADLSVTDRQERERDGYDARIDGGHLFVRTYGWTGAFDAYRLSDPAAPSFDRTLDVAGFGADVRVVGDLALVPAGLGGLQVFDLAQE